MRAAQLHNHTEFSNLRMLDCIIKVEKLIDRAVELGMSVAITDHEALSGHVRAIKHVKKGKESGKIPEDFKLILGNEIYLVDEILEEDGKKYCPTPYYHFILLAKDEVGHRQLRELSSDAWEQSFNTGKMTRVPTLKSDLERVVRANPGHLIASTACIGGELGKNMLEAMNTGSVEAAEKSLDFASWCRGLFGEDFYLEMQPGQSEEQLYVNQQILALSEIYGIETIITCDTHYLKKEDKEVHAAYLNSRSDEDRETGDFYDYTYMMGEDEIHELMDQHIGKEEVDRALRNTAVIADKVEEYDLYHPTIVPRSEIPEFEVEHVFRNYYDRCPYIKKFAYSEDVNDRYLLKLIENGFFEKLPFNTWSKEKVLEYVNRIEVELMEMWMVTEKLGESISSYYLKTLELVNLMWEEGDSIVGAARGSVTGMETMYLIGITQIDPIPWGLPHWRHISHEKVELSDVDIDSQRNRRKNILFAIQSKYTERKVLNSCTFKTEGSKLALLTACRGLGVDNDVAQYLAGMIPITRGFTWSLTDCVYGNMEEQRKPQKEFVNEIAKYPGVLETAMAIEGLVSGRSIHASALYLFNGDYLEHNAMMRAPNGQPTTQFNMKDSDYMSALKEDMLTVSALDKIRFCMDMLVENGHMEWQGSLRKTYDKYLHPDVLDYDTQEMWDWVGEGKVIDLFQFNTQVGIQAAKKIKPHSLKELAAANSVMRLMIDKEGAEQPIDTYIRYKNNINEWYDCMRQEYHLTEDEIHTVEPYLKPTYGVGDTQEVVMQLSMDPKISGFNVKQSNLLRKSISKKSKELQLEMKEYFFKHGKEIGTSDNLLNYIWDEVVGKQLG